MADTHEKPCILICEDETDIAVDLQSRLKSLGYAVCAHAASEETARELAERHHPDLIMMDVAFKGGMDGIDAADVVRDELGIPVIFLAADDEIDCLERSRPNHPAGYVLKPFQNRDLKCKIETALYLSKLEAERRRIEADLRKSEERFRFLVDNVSAVIFQRSARDGRYVFISQGVARLTGYTPDDFYRDQNLIKTVISTEVFDYFVKRLENPSAWTEPVVDIFPFFHKSGERKWAKQIVTPVLNGAGDLVATQGVILEITDLKQVELERENLITELQNALKEIKELRGFLPICSNCKKIRDDEGYWQQVDMYIQQRTDARFTHGICPECMKKLYPDIADRLHKKKEND